ncbi:hypothetical protein ACXAUS_003476 [Clostridium sporogenes]
MKNIDDLDKELKKSLGEFAYGIQNKLCTFEGESLSEYDLEDIARYTFYMMDDFRKHIIEYLKDNKNA